MAEKPLAAVRKKPNSSVVVGLGLQKAGKSDAFVSAGNTGAVLAASTVLLGLHPGVERATVATPFPTADLPVLVLDGGANVDCSAQELVGFARLGIVYARDVLGRERPLVGLLNIGEEDEKGNAASRQAHELLKQTPGLNYIGNIEGRDILAGHSKRRPRRRGGARRLRRQHRAQVLRVGGPPHPAAGQAHGAGHPGPGRRAGGLPRPRLRRVRRRAAPRRARRLHHLPRLLRRQRHQERHPGGRADRSRPGSTSTSPRSSLRRGAPAA